MMILATGIAALALVACNREAPATSDAATPSPASAAAPAATPSPDDEIAQLKAVTPLDACATLTQDKLKTVYPDLTFAVHQTLAPRMSGYTWDSRCSYRAGVGTIEFAKDASTHSVDIMIATVVSEAKAQANLASRAETAKTTNGYQPQPDLGANAYAVTDTAMARLYFVKGQSEIEIDVSDLQSPNAEKIAKAVALAKTL
jgi:hypothetical protein